MFSYIPVALFVERRPCTMCLAFLPPPSASLNLGLHKKEFLSQDPCEGRMQNTQINFRFPLDTHVRMTEHSIFSKTGKRIEIGEVTKEEAY